MTTKTSCPRCGNQQLQIAVETLADVNFSDDGDHEIVSTYGHIGWKDDSLAVCDESRYGCGWVGTVGELTTTQVPECTQ